MYVMAQEYSGADASNERQYWHWHYGTAVCIQIWRTLGNSLLMSTSSNVKYFMLFKSNHVSVSMLLITCVNNYVVYYTV